MEVCDDICRLILGKQVEGKFKKKDLILKFLDISKNDLEDFVIKIFRQVMKRKEDIDNDIICDINDSIVLFLREINISIVFILFECDDSFMECIVVVELDGIFQYIEIKIVKEVKSSEIDDVVRVLEGYDIIFV